MLDFRLTGQRALGLVLFISLAAAVVPASICLLLLKQTQQEILTVEEVKGHARHTRVLVEQLGQSLFTFTAAALDLSVEERDAVFRETDQHFAALNDSLATQGNLATQYLSPDEQQEMTEALVSISDTWEEIRDRSQGGITAPEKAFHFLKLFKDAQVARELVRKLQARADFAADQAVTSSLQHLKESGLSLLVTMALGAAVSLIALVRNHRFAATVASTNRDLGSAVARLKQRDEELEAQNERFSMALENMSQGLCMFDEEQRLIVCNARFGAIYDLPPELMISGTRLPDILQHCTARELIDEAGRETLLLGAACERAILELRNGRIIKLAHQPMSHGGWVGTHEDVTESRKAEARIAHMARHDALTGLPNRVLFREELDRAVMRAHDGERVSVLCVDLDHFKSVNDTLGHPIGDALLQAVAGRLKGCARNSDTVARLGGDEFAVVQLGATDLAETNSLAQRVIDALSAPYELQGHQVIVGTSVGIALAPTDSSDPDQILKCADMALYRAKADGRGTYRFFEAEMDAKMQARRRLEVDLRKAMANEEFEVYYQPLVDSQSEQVSGFEALLRWNHAERGFVPPAEFIPLAEEIGLIGRIGAWVLMQACNEATAWPDHIKIAVNLSPVQFKGQALVLDVVAALGASGLAARRLELEITETVMLQDTEATLAILHQLRALGVRISMDDFGTGYSSLSYLQKFPFDRIKIDQSFVRDLSGASNGAAIVRAVTSLSADLGMLTTAEGVETQEQFDKVRLEGCTEVQGYLFSKPRPASEVTAMLADRAGQARNVA